MRRFYEGGWYFAVKYFAVHDNADGFVAWAGRNPLKADSPIFEDPTDDIYFEFGQTEEDALVKLKAEVFGFAA